MTSRFSLSFALPFACLLLFDFQPQLIAQPAGSAVRGSVVEDRAAKKLIEAGDTRYEAEEQKKAVDIWESVLERYPRSKFRFVAHMKLGDHFLKKDRAYDAARKHYEVVTIEDNRDETMRAEATLKMGVCFYEARNFGKTFKVMREVIEKFPVSTQVNEAYYYIGLGHFQLGHYSRAIAALERVGTAFSEDDDAFEKVEAGKRLFVRIEDADLAALTPGETVMVKCKTKHGDEEVVECFPVGRNVRLVMGSILTDLGKPKVGNGRLEVQGDDEVDVTYVDKHTAEKKFNEPRLQHITVIGNAVATITDGAFRDTLNGVVLGKEMNLQVTDADLDLSHDADKLTAIIEVRREKTEEEITSEIADLKIKAATDPSVELDENDEPKVNRFKVIDHAKVVLVEVKVNREEAANAVLPDGGDAVGTISTEPPADSTDGKTDSEDLPESVKKPSAGDSLAKEVEAAAVDHSIHSGVFRNAAMLVLSDEVIKGDAILQAIPGDQLRLVFEDKENITADPVLVHFSARAVEGNLGGVRVTRTEISNKELRLNTQLKTASALTNIGNRYKEFGLKQKSLGKYAQALMVCEEIMGEARKLGGNMLEQTYVQLWRIYFEMDKLELAAAMCQRLAREFPESPFVDEALIQLAKVARKRGDFKRAVGLYSRLVGTKTSQLRGEGQFGIAECYEAMAKGAKEGQGEALFDRAFVEYKKVFEQFPDSGRVGEAVAKMANFYYQKQDYNRAIDVFETVLSEHPDAKYLDVILFNYGRCLYRMERKKEARAKFDQLIGDFPESALATDAKRIADALTKGGF